MSAQITFRVGGDPDAGSSKLGPWLHWLGVHGEEQVTHRWPLGCWSLDLGLHVDGRWPRELAGNRTIDAYVGGQRIWSGLLDEPDRAEGRITARGLNRQGETAAALTAGGKATTDAGTAITAAINRRAVSWQMGPVIPGALTTATETNHLGALLDAWCEVNGTDWLVDAEGIFRLSPPPTTPSLFLDLGDLDLGVSSDRQATHVYAGYMSTTLDYPDPVVAGSAASSYRVERLVDLVPRGPITQAQAQAVANGLLAKVGTRMSFTQVLEVTEGQVTNAGGVVVPLQHIRPAMAQLRGVTDPRDASPHTNLIIGETVWDVREKRVRLTPFNADVADLASVVENEQGSVIL